jgi:hypothetical protein
LPRNGSRILDITDARTEQSVERPSVGVEEQDALSEQRRCGGVESDDVVITGEFKIVLVTSRIAVRSGSASIDKPSTWISSTR